MLSARQQLLEAAQKAHPGVWHVAEDGNRLVLVGDFCLVVLFPEGTNGYEWVIQVQMTKKGLQTSRVSRKFLVYLKHFLEGGD